MFKKKKISTRTPLDRRCSWFCAESSSLKLELFCDQFKAVTYLLRGANSIRSPGIQNKKKGERKIQEQQL